MRAGERVRLKGSPGEIGVLTDQRRLRGTREYVAVSFPNGKRQVPLDQLELVTVGETPSDLLRAGRLARAVDLRRAITHRRLSGRLADVIYSMEATNTDFYPYQFKPVLKLLASPTNGLLIADEVGLGKTIEAGLIWTELRARYDMRRLLVICPAALREKWRFELTTKLGVDAEIGDAKEVLERLQDPDARRRGFALIASMQGLRPPSAWREEVRPERPGAKLAAFLLEKESDERLLDLLVIDEAHHLRNPLTATNELGQLLREVTEYRLLLTATPVHNRSQDLFSALTLLDPDTFRFKEDFEEIVEANEPLIRARDAVLKGAWTPSNLINVLDQATAHPLLQRNRQLAAIREAVSGQEKLTDPELRSRIAHRLESANLLANTVTRTRKRDVTEFRVTRQPIAEFVTMNDAERTFYERVSELIRNYALQRDVSERFLLATPQRQLTSSMAAALRLWHRRQIQLEESDEGDAVAGDSIFGPLATLLAERAPTFATFEALSSQDTKYDRLESVLRHALSLEAGAKIVVFSGFRETLCYLAERLGRMSISTALLMGASPGGPRRTKEDIIHGFHDPDGPSVLLTSEVGGEGIDLQFSHFLVNYDLPWNPMRVEQRIGRLDRLGQEAKKIVIWNLLHRGTIDERIYVKLYAKLRLCERSLGDFEAVLGDEIRALTQKLLSGELSPEQQERQIDQTATALENLKREQEELESKAVHLLAHGDYILHRVQQAHELRRWISGDDVRMYVVDLFRRNYPGSEFRQVDERGLRYEISLSNAAKAAFEQYVDLHQLRGTRLIDTRPEPVLCQFAHRAGVSDRTRAELISQFHPVVRFVGDELRGGEDELRPATGARVRSDEAGVPPGTYIVAASFWSIRGLRTIENLAFAGARAEGEDVWRSVGDDIAERVALAASQFGTDWGEAAGRVQLGSAFDVAEDAFARLVDRFEAFTEEVAAENADRADIQERTLRQHLHQQRSRLHEILDAQRRANNRIAKATAGRIAALESRVERELLKIGQRRDVESSQDEILVALVDVWGGNGDGREEEA